MIKTIAVIEGDDAAPEAMKPVIALLQSLNIGLEWVYPVVGAAAAATWAPCRQFAPNDNLIKETQLVWIKYTRSRAECYTHDT